MAATDESLSPRRLVCFALLVEGSLALVAWGLGYLLGVPAAGGLAWDLPAVLLGIAASLPLLLLMLALVRWPVGPLRALKELVEQYVVPLFAGCGVGELALIAIAAGVGEELLFRGLLQRWLAGLAGELAGWLLASLVFGLAHAISRTYTALATVLGLYLGWLLIATGNVLVPILTHALYDFVALVYLVHRHRAAAHRADSLDSYSES